MPVNTIYCVRKVNKYYIQLLANIECEIIRVERSETTLTLIAHKADDGREQPLDKHLQNVSRLAAEYAEPIGGQAIARRAGLAHDTGKCTDGFQRYIRDKVFFGELDEATHHLYCSPDTFSIESSVRDCLKDVIKEGSKGSKKAMDRETELKAYNALCKYFFDARTFGMVNTSFSGSSVIGKIKGAFQLSMPVSFDPVNIIPMTITRCCVSSDAERIGAEKDSKKKNVNTDEDGENRKNPKDRMMGRRSFVEYGLYHMSIQINSMMAQRNGITMDDVNLLIDALQHMFENDMSSGRALTLRKLIVVEHTKPMGNVPRDTIENALTATLKIPDDCPTSYNDYIVTFHRNLLPKEVKVTEYGIDGSSKVML